MPHVWTPSPNFGARRPNVVILHHTGDNNTADALKTLTDPSSQVSAHYLVGRDGSIYQLVDERARAWHAGIASWGSDTDINSDSIGIELDNDGSEPFAEPEIAALLLLLADLQGRYHVPSRNFLGHADVAPRRKVDPSRRFPWRRLALAGFGMWCDPPFPKAPEHFDTALALRALGYAGDSYPAALAAFKLHFAPDDLEVGETDQNRDQIYCLLQFGSSPQTGVEREGP
ncbi:MAG: N-acetylmuramoyl-L-alanine amidase [Burkholderiaceae bacterium]